MREARVGDVQHRDAIHRELTDSVIRRASLRLLLLAAITSTAALSGVARADDAPKSDAAKHKLTRPPEIVQFVEAPYPDSEKAAGRTASVVLEVAISASGAVDSATVVTSAGPAFDAAAVAAVRHFVFRPAEIDNQPAPVRIQYRYDFVMKEAAPPAVATFEGVVENRSTKAPLAGVTVTLDGAGNAVTDDKGLFTIENVAPGPHTIALSRADLPSLQTQETFEAGKKLDAVYDVDVAPPGKPAADDGEDLEIVVAAPKLTKQVASTVVEAEQAQRVAGTQGDVLKVVENLPGVARATAGSGAVVVWGAAPESTPVYVDGVRIPLLYHFGGLRSVIHTDLVQSVELLPGGYGATYGRGLGGLVTVEKRAPASDRLHGSVDLDLLDASASVTGPIADKWRVEGAVRRSHLDWVLDRVTSRDVGEFFPVPKYYDGQAALRYQATQHEWVEVGGLLSSDSLVHTDASSDPSQRKSQTQDLFFDRAWVRYEKVPGDGSQVVVVPWVGQDHSSLVENFGGTPSSLDVHSTSFGLRASRQGPVTPFMNATVGIDLEATSSTVRRAGSITTPPREGDPFIFGEPPSDLVNSDAWKAVLGSAAPYAEGDIGLLADRLHVVPGLRIEPFFSSVNRRSPPQGDNLALGAFGGDVAVEPRLQLRYALTPRVAFKAAYGKYRQAPAATDLSSVFGNPLLEPSSATHWVGGVSVDITRTIHGETTVFYSHSDGLAVRNPSATPALAQSLVGTGQGRSYGMQVLLRRELTKGLFGWIAYTLLRSERLDQPGGTWRLFDFDQTHVLTALASYDLGKGFDVGARFRYATGFPRTPVIGNSFDARRGIYDPTLGAYNSVRLPAFVSLDVRFAKRFKIGATELEAYADVQNVTDRENDEELVYNADYTQKRYIRGLPILPIIGAKWTY